MKDLGKDSAIKIEKDVVHINGFDANTQEDFYKKMKPFVQVVSSQRYQELLDERGFLGGGIASAYAEFRRSHDINSSRISKSTLEKIFIVVNKDAYVGTEDTLMQAAIRHELAELWVLGKLGFSLYPSPDKDMFQAERSFDLAHQFARKEELHFAITQGFGAEELAFIERNSDPEETQRSKNIYTKILTQRARLQKKK